MKAVVVMYKGDLIMYGERYAHEIRRCMEEENARRSDDG